MLENASLKSYHTFGIEVKARFLVEVHSPEELQAFYQDPAFAALPKLILGGGSNVLFTQDFPGLVLVNRLQGIEVLAEDDFEVHLKVASGENWHALVQYCVERNWGGIENLSLIPGTVGAAPMQNIGAYGVEIKEVLEKVEFLNLENFASQTLSNADCQFGYRESIFKHELKGKAFITAVYLKLQKRGHLLKMNYGDIRDKLEEARVNEPGIADISKAVIAIRQSKLPNPAELGNAGSFFKNPIVAETVLHQIQTTHPLVPFYPAGEGLVKVPAGWLIEQSGWKGKRVGNTGSHARQALVLVNYGDAKTEEVRDLAYAIIADVESKFGIRLHPEVNFV
ncbi:MAG: UDP-N-acetylmuramate dehydrogenase [Bacteroidetes bacterium]|nr:MAG: UDP-N-acetylmuramate dehydrogenase [Bacteroidota bacterium]